MPGIVVFNRRWVVGSDDFVIPFGIAFVLRVIWMISLGVMLALYHSFDQDAYLECESTFDYFTSGYIVLLFATNLVEFLVSWLSSKGTIMDDTPRQVIPTVLYIRLCFSITEIFWLSLGLKWIFIDGEECESSPGWRISKGVVIFNWMFLIFVALLVFCSFDSAGKDWVRMVKHARTEHYDTIRTQISDRYMSRWKEYFQCFCACSGVNDNMNDQSIYGFIGMTLSEFFQDLDVVPSDIAAGLVLLRLIQKREENRLVYQCLADALPMVCKPGKGKVTNSFQKTRKAKPFTIESREECRLFEDVVHYAHYAVGAYGWPVYLLTDLKCACCSLASTMRCCYSCRKQEAKFGPVLEDNCCQCNFSAVKQTLSDFFEDVQIIYTSFVDELYVSPFYVAVDHAKKSVIISIRGTLSLQNILTDLIVEPEKIPCSRSHMYDEWYAHKGMLRTALSVKNVLETKGILTEAFDKCPPNERNNYQLIIVGHSLGAGAAAVLSILLKEKYPNLFCYAYSPPGATLSSDATKYAEDFILSVVIGKDMIARMSLNNLKDLRDRVLFLVSRTRKPKWKILRRCVWRSTMCCCCGPTKAKDNHLPDADVDQLERKFREFTRQSSSTPDFYPPGKVLHLAKVKSIKGRCFNKEKEFELFWSTSEDFEEILISSLMWSDHMPDFVLKVLKDTLHRLNIRSDKASGYSPPCRSHHHGLQRCLSDNGSCYISVLDSPTGAIVDQPGDVDLSFV
ncbi:sn1-specific diacylglycerol lipase alpha-like isoform X2 [Dendronephthya gigantea]|nr:sn1-specific diacylglycerol lipase alpha-like isoform X2 [Dendronephthya gigantea]